MGSVQASHGSRLGPRQETNVYDSKGNVNDSASSRTEAVRAMILSDKTGGVLNRLKAIASSRGEEKTESGGSTTPEEAQVPHQYDLGPEPKKPPRRGTSKSSKAAVSSGDEGDRANSNAFVDVTMNL